MQTIHDPRAADKELRAIEAPPLPGDLSRRAGGWLFSRDGRAYLFREDHRGGHIYDLEATVHGCRRRWWTLDPTIADCRREAARAIAGDDPDLEAVVRRDLWLASMLIRFRRVDDEIHDRLAELEGTTPAAVDLALFQVPPNLAERIVELAVEGDVTIRERASS